MNIVRVDNSIKIPTYLGQVDGWEDYIVDLEKINHLLITGVSGCGKSTLIHNILMNLIHYKKPQELKLLLIDEHIVELSIYNSIPHLLLHTVTDSTKIQFTFDWVISIIKKRLYLFSQFKCRNIFEYNNYVRSFDSISLLSDIVIVYDGYFIESHNYNDDLLSILTQGRQTGIHVILSTCTTKGLKNIIEIFPAYACFKSTTKVSIHGIKDSYINTLGLYEIQYLDQYHSEPIKLSIPDIDSTELKRFINKQTNVNKSSNTQRENNQLPNQAAKSEIDEYFQSAARLIIDSNKASIGLLQRKFKIGFNRAARIMDQLAGAGIVGPDEGSNPRKILMSTKQFEEYVEKYL